jgi:photosystem II stability/assembly factor-like uncharacterized protein
MREKRWLAGVGLAATLAAVLMGSAGAPLAAQVRPPRRPTGAVTAPAGTTASDKGIWELVNYKQDLKLTDVFFASKITGWVTGEHGTLLKTTDGGDTWTAVLGGDPAAPEDPIERLKFIDATHGWAVKGRGNLLRTTDGENWEQIGKLGEQYGYFNDYAFFSDRVGVQIVKEHNELARTQDGGKTWKVVQGACEIDAEVDGLTRKLGCSLSSLVLLSASQGYAIGATKPGTHMVLFRTEDAGKTWTPQLVPDVASSQESYFWQGIAFVDANHGFAILDKRFLGTTDAGKTWHGVIGTVHGPLKFADPEVGWSFNGEQLTYTVDGGKRWTSTTFPFAGIVTAFSLPHRDVAYVVGDHGMIYRYSVVPAETVVPKALPAPAMPGMATALASDVAQLDGQFAALDGFVQSAPDAAGSAAGAGGDASTGGAVGAAGSSSGAGGDFSQSPPSAFVTGCCGKRLSALELVLKAVGGIVPDFISKYKNLNLLAQGLRTAAALPEMSDSLRTAFRSFRTAADRPAAASALSGLKNILGSLKAAVDTALQKRNSQPGGQ